MAIHDKWLFYLLAWRQSVILYGDATCAFVCGCIGEPSDERQLVAAANIVESNDFHFNAAAHKRIYRLPIEYYDLWKSSELREFSLLKPFERGKLSINT